MTEMLSQPSEPSAVPQNFEDLPEVPACCQQTIEKLAKCNQMMVCGQCRQIIKVFDEITPFKHFVRFCESRNRVFIKGAHRSSHGYLYVVIYPSFHGANR